MPLIDLNTIFTKSNVLAAEIVDHRIEIRGKINAISPLFIFQKELYFNATNTFSTDMRTTGVKPYPNMLTTL